MPSAVPVREVVRYIRRHYPWVEGPEDLDAVPEILSRAGADEEFCFSVRLDAEMIRGCCERGYIPMGAIVEDVPFLLIKLHQWRSVLSLGALRVGKTVRRNCRDLDLVMDTDFDRSLDATHSAHPESWLHDSLRRGYSELHRSDPDSAAPTVRFHAIELLAGSQVVAGEIGYVTGRLYTSASGYYRRSGAGSVQLVALALQLRRSGFSYWDLGMDLPYKRALGAEIVPRAEFLQLVREEARGAAVRPAAPGERIAVTALLADRS